MPVKKYKRELGFLILIIGLLLFWYLGRYIPLNIPAIQSALSKFPLVLSSILYVVLYVVITFFIFFSKDFFWISGALLFGPFLSALLICIAETINAFILFYMARLLGRAYVEKQVSKKYQYLDAKLGRINFFWLFIFRAAPLIPYRFMDLAAGLTRISFKRYILAVILGSPVKIFWIQFILYAVGQSVVTHPAVLAEYFLSHKTFFLFSLVYIILMGLAVFKVSSKE
ncbi:MAG: VTT domain-containing protein [Candidatus Omnitrophica bacterium]|nr:VTT domain-containing protein [Candidatus Omnitrophota bacterium]